jgi:hypothetical protein
MARNEVIPILCPKCCKETKKTAGWLEDNPRMPILCPSCGASLGDEFAKVAAAIKESEIREAERFGELKRGPSGKDKAD